MEQLPFEFVRVGIDAPLPPLDPRVVEIAVLDMNHGFENVGHDAIIEGLRGMTVIHAEALERAGLSVRVASFDVRRSHVLPDPPGERFLLYVGTGGPGHLDPRENDGIAAWSQGVLENPDWESGLFALFDHIRNHEDAALLGVCHTFGLLCRWSGFAHPTLRGSEHGGKSSGVRQNVLTPAAMQHPWFKHFAAALGPEGRCSVLDSRLFDLVPTRAAFWSGITEVAYAVSEDGSPGREVTMLEFARDRDGVMPRIFAVNSHPELLEAGRIEPALNAKLVRGEVTRAWYDERMEALAALDPATETGDALRRTANAVFHEPLAWQFERVLAHRAALLGMTFNTASARASGA